MCSNGVNASQFEQMIDMADDHIGIGYRWAHNMAHAAAEGGYASASEKLHAAQALLADCRALLDEAKTCIEEGVLVSNGVTAKRM
ncbi:dynein gamma chain protein [Eggerthella sinensis]|uniref:dynein gamma chain protein n=1 Tax=Eggerthella sinensis TaxID=242230 RepID=UPI00266B968F|nr:dynein gamma chain protein [Eggerthella sinensis]